MAAEAAVTFLLENVTQLLKSYVKLIAGAKDELEGLKSDLDRLRSILKDASKTKKGEQFRQLEREIREVVYDVEDTLDLYLTNAANGKLLSKATLASKVKSLRRGKVKEAFDRAKDGFPAMETNDSSATDAGTSRRQSVQLPIREDNVVGFKEEKAEIIGYLKEETPKLDVISIIGMAGLGKITLAWKIFHDQDIQYNFPRRIWIYVSQEFDLTNVLLQILRQFTSRDMSRDTDQEIVRAVRKYLSEEKFLLVMDDVWTTDAWDAISLALPKESEHGKVVITSRNGEVGHRASLTGKLHNLRFLKNDESWELLQYEVFGALNKCPLKLESTGKYIAEHCDGLPLTVVVIGGVLAHHFSEEDMGATKDEWETVSTNVNAHLLQDDEKEQRILKAVELSYTNLSEMMRNCFLYLGVFPEDHEISAWTLTCLWIAEGFIPRKEGQSPEETAQRNLHDLISRNLVMVVEKSPQGKVKTCRVHDVIREFCNTKAGIKEQNLFCEVKTPKGVFDPPVSEIGNYRRLCISSQIVTFLKKKPKGPKVRSFVCCNKDHSQWTRKIYQPFLKPFLC